MRGLGLLRALLLVGLLVAAMAGHAPAAELLGCSQYGDLFAIDATSGAAALIGPLGPGQDTDLSTEIEYDLGSSTLYAEETNGGIYLHTVDETTGASLGTVEHIFGSLAGLEFVGDTLYGAFHADPGGASDLVTVDTSTGGLTTIGQIADGPVSGLAWHAPSQTMYGVTAGGAAADVVTIDLATGAGTVVGPTGFDHVGSIEFASDGVLYGGLAQDATSNAGWLFSIDLATGTGTLVGDTGYSITGLTNRVPEPATMALMGLGAAALVAGRRGRKRG